MVAVSNISFSEIPWQANCTGFIFHFKDHLKAALEDSFSNPKMPKKELTKEAAIMICVIFAIILLSVFGSGITMYDYFSRGKETRRISQIKKKEDNLVNNDKRSKNKKTNLLVYAFFKNCKCFMKSFCIFKNGKRILSADSSEGQMDCIQGLRFFFSSCVIIFHIITLYMVVLNEPGEAKPYLELEVSQLLLNIDYAIDAFFVISGFLNAYFFFRLYSYSNGDINWAYFYLKRFLRLTPVYMLVLGIYTNLYTYTGTGIIWPSFSTNPNCKKHWWWYILYINNYCVSALECMIWCWHLAVEMQLYMVSPLFFISIIRWPRMGLFIIFTCIAGSCAASFLLTYWLDLPIGFSQIFLHLGDLKQFYEKYLLYAFLLHIHPYIRICAYLIGILLGYILNKKSLKINNLRNNKVTLWCGWITTGSFIWINFFLSRNREVSLMEKAFLNATKSLFPSCCVAWIIYVCLTGQSRFLNSCLSCRLFFPFGRLSYCAYLIHSIIIFRFFHQTVDLIYFDIMALIWLSAYILILTYLISFILSLVLEMPILNILESYINRRRGSINMYCLNREKQIHIYKNS